MNQGVTKMYTITLISNDDDHHILDFLDPTWTVQCLQINPVNAKQTDCFLVDIDYCDHDGETLIPWIQQQYDRPILILTSRYRPKRVLELMIQGAHDYLVEPFDHHTVIHRINTLIDVYQKQKKEPN